MDRRTEASTKAEGTLSAPPGRIEALAMELAESHKLSAGPRRRRTLKDRIQDLAAVLQEAYQHFASEGQLSRSYASEWLLDNFHVVQQALREIHTDIPDSYYRQLPELDTSSPTADTRIYAVAREYVESSEGRVDLPRLTRFVQAYQRVTPLTTGELWALPSMLRLSILEKLAHAVDQLTAFGVRESEGIATTEPSALTFTDEATVASSILSLRTVATQDWEAFFEEISQVELILRRDPANVYARMDFQTRDRYRKAVEALARATEQEETKAAQEAVRLAAEAQQNGPESPRRQHIGFYLVDEGRATLESRLGYRPPWRARPRRWLLRHPIPVYLGGIALLTLLLLLAALGYGYAVGGSSAQLLLTGLLVVLPVSMVAINLTNWLVTHTLPPRVLPKMDFRDGVPAEHRTMVVVPALLSNAREVDSLLQQLELHYLSSRDRHVHFALLTDFADAPHKHMPEDEVLLEQGNAGIRALNRKYGGRRNGSFYLFHRERRWSPGEDSWIGWERKRGKLMEFNRLLRGATETSYVEQVGNLDVLPHIKYVITLDADTALPGESARRLIATLAHPLNHAHFDPKSGRVVAGYTILQPRVEITPASANRSPFARVFAGDASVDLYARAVSDVYQDLFGEGIYVGKGIYDVDAFERSVAGRVPDNTLLSHDLLEGIHGRVGLLTDVTLFEDYPPQYLSYAHRSHRWVRGDWQLFPWLLPVVPQADGRGVRNYLSTLGRWQILDNLRRSLRAPALLALFVGGWSFLPGSPLVWTLAGAAVPAMDLITSTVTGLAQTRALTWVRGITHPTWSDAGRWLLHLVFLPYAALLTLDAIGSTLVRVIVTHRHLLQWTTAAHTIYLFGRETKVAISWRRMGGGPILAVAVALSLALINPSALLVAAPLLLAWLLSPQIAHWISRPVMQKETVLTVDQRRQLRGLARRTWLYFEQFVGPDDNWLPPDHYQQDPRGTVAHRTSPTNIGLGLLSNLAAYDLGYSGPTDLALRLQYTFQSMDRLQRYRGHFLNWYDTRTRKPLPPRYVSTVDSGNLAGCLLTLAQGLMDLPHDPVQRWKHWEGLIDVLDVVNQIVGGPEGADMGTMVADCQAHLSHMRQQILAAKHDPESWPALLARLCETDWQELVRLLREAVESASATADALTLAALRISSARIRHHVFGAQRELDMLLPWAMPLTRPPALFSRPETGPVIANAWQALVDALPANPPLKDIPSVCEAAEGRLAEVRQLLGHEAAPDKEVAEAGGWCASLAEGLESAHRTAEDLLKDYQELGAQAEAYAQAMQFSFLFDPQRQIFHIGYNVTTGTLDPNYYDLLASEARLASLVAVAKGDVPQSHWVHLSRPFGLVDGTRVLLSWTGSMFEYLMPSLLMRNYEGTFLDQSRHAAVERQMEYGRQKRVPWGISEAGYYAFDGNMNYQYGPFGVPGLGLKRGLDADLVVAPYASLLALPVQPQSVVRNLGYLTQLGMLGLYGFCESIDYTHSRLPVGQTSAIVRSYYAHHQGMSLLALSNYLHDEAMVRRFHADPRVQSVELLLQEQTPRRPEIEYIPPEEVPVARRARPLIAYVPWRVPVESLVPQVHLLSNGRYGLLITSAGSGYSRWQHVDLTRWRADPTLDGWGTWVYIQDQENGALWSAGCQPTACLPVEHEVLFHAHKAEFRRRDHDISMHTEITVPPQEDVEIRRITLTNDSDRPRRLMLTSYGEVVLAPQEVDRSHPAFNKLFIESEYLPKLNALLFRRRPRSSDEEPVYLAHALVLERRQKSTTAHEGDRALFLARGGTPRSPQALSQNGRGLSGSTGATLDPVMALGQEVELKPYATTQLAYLTAVAESREGALALLDRYRDWNRVNWAFGQARSTMEFELRQHGMSTPEVERIQRLLSALLYPHRGLRADPTTLAANVKGQSGLWAHGISGDYPILLVRVGGEEAMDLLLELLRAHAYWRERQLKIDLVVLNQVDLGYDQRLHRQLQSLIARTGSDTWLNRRGGIFLLYAGQLDETDRVLLETVARVVLDGEKGSLAQQLGRVPTEPVRLPPLSRTLPSEDLAPTPPLARPSDLLFDNGLGGFTADGREYVIYLERDDRTPAPWINVIANPSFGFLVSEAGSGYTWAENSGENRLTPWNNDPVADPPGEALYLRDEETGQVWSPTPLPARDDSPYLIRHGAGYSVFEHNSHGLKQHLRLFAVPDAPVKVVQLRLENTWQRARRITATFYAEWVLGTSREDTQQYIIPEFDGESQALLARNPYHEDCGGRVAFAAASKQVHGLTADRTEFLGRHGSLSQPAALERVGLASAVEPGLDPCAALQIHVDLGPGESEEVFFLLGQGADREETSRLLKRYRDGGQVEAAWASLTEFWDNYLGTVTVETPDPAMNLMMNRWLLYQGLSCRIWGRAALYQSSGAFGFRDQLQDVMSLMHAAPDLARAHILRAARHQFEEGDVLHWWHPPSGRGVRTRFSDDLLWLPFVTAHYVTTTGDASILKEKAPFVMAEPLKPEEQERYGSYEISDEAHTLYEHCRRALEKGSTAGEHGLPLMGTGDWTDALNRVGIGGKGESVWVGWFLYATLTTFAPLCELMGDEKQAAAYQKQASDLRQALEANSWDGDWYLRAYYDDGTPLGSAEDDECQISSLTQSWAVLSGAADPERASRAMESVAKRLVQDEDQLILLLAPPFDKTSRDPGYMKGYPPGIRENGGQYTHAATWVVWAFAELGLGDRAQELFRFLNPIYHGSTPEQVARYHVEPYAMAGDVYSVEPRVGHGGWTWYTGSAGWMYRVGLEAILGLKRTGDSLRIDPCIPKDWPGFEVTYSEGDTSYHIRVENPRGVNRGVREITLDREPLPEREIPLVGDGEAHEIQVVMG